MRGFSYDSETGRVERTTLNARQKWVAREEALGRFVIFGFAAIAGRDRVIDVDEFGVPTLEDYQPPEPPLEMVKNRALAELALFDRQTRALFVTDAPGKDAEYREKEAEAQAIKAEIAAGEAPDPADYPWAASELGINGATLEAVADLYLANAALWRPIGQALNAIKQSARSNIAVAPTTSAVESAKQQALTALTQIGGI